MTRPVSSTVKPRLRTLKWRIHEPWTLVQGVKWRLRLYSEGIISTLLYMKEKFLM